MIKNNFNYSETYFEGLLTGWNKVSYPIISKFAETSLKKYRPRTILDLGCGSGIYFNLFKQYATDVDGIDVSEQSVMLCREKGYRLVKLADAVALPFPDESFDYVFTSEVLEHVEDHTTMLKEIQRVLKPNGILLLTTTCYSTSIFQLISGYKGGALNFIKEVGIYIAGFASKEKRNRFVRKWCFEVLGGHYHGFSPNALKKDVTNAGMSVLEKKTFYAVPPTTPFASKELRQSATSKEKNHSLPKRSAMLLASLLIGIADPVFKFLHILSNNVYILAKKNSF
jgi:2-polyprenyl-3-methyl-5-hydroxy-6-metoxy-1,4-benzoquinol methylase